MSLYLYKMKLKTLLLLNEFSVPGSLTSGDHELVPWSGVTEGDDWFAYAGNNHHNVGESYCSVTITETDKPVKYWATIKTRGLRKPNDTTLVYHERIRKRTDRAKKAWMSAAKRLHKDPKRVTECGNLIMRSWSEAFKEALDDPRVKTLINKYGEGKMGSQAPIVDPVNFTPRMEAGIIKGTNLPEIIINEISSGKITDEYDVVQLIDRFTESMKIDTNHPLINSTWNWFQSNKTKLLTRQ